MKIVKSHSHLDCFFFFFFENESSLNLSGISLIDRFELMASGKESMEMKCLPHHIIWQGGGGVGCMISTRLITGDVNLDLDHLFRVVSVRLL